MSEIETKIKQYFESIPGVIAVYTFGSLARGRLNKFSDIDIAILLTKEVKGNLYLDLRLKYMQELSSLLKREVDIIILNYAIAPFLKYQVFKYGKAVLERDQKKSRNFKARSLMEYFDFKPIKNFYESAIIKKLKGLA